jgi:hypothetical protein
MMLLKRCASDTLTWKPLPGTGKQGTAWSNAGTDSSIPNIQGKNDFNRKVQEDQWADGVAYTVILTI